MIHDLLVQPLNVMKLGFGFYRHMLCKEYYDFAVQCGATHAIVHLCDYGMGNTSQKNDDQPIGELEGWGRATHPEVWSLNEVLEIKRDLERNGLKFFAVENFDPAQWHDVLLHGPMFKEQIKKVKEQIRIYGQAGIPVLGYNFSLAGVAGRLHLETRGGAPTVGLQGRNEITEAPIPKGMIWNMRYADGQANDYLPRLTHDQLWANLRAFLKEVVPVAEEAGVVLAAHPDDPPLKFVRQQPRLVIRHHLYQKLLEMAPSPSNALEFCVGTLAEMPDKDLYGCIEHYAKQNKIAYVHLRNVRGKVPNYTETFIDDGDVDIRRVLEILQEFNFSGVIIPDHAPQMSCEAPWHAGMAYAMGYLKAQMNGVKKMVKTHQSRSSSDTANALSGSR